MIFIFVGSTVMLLAFLAAYLDVSPFSFDIPTLAGKIPDGLQYLPLLASFIGFAVKLPVVPFHSWLPDAYSQAPGTASSGLASGSSHTRLPSGRGRSCCLGSSPCSTEPSSRSLRRSSRGCSPTPA
jgi:hypothetical protein